MSLTDFFEAAKDCQISDDLVKFLMQHNLLDHHFGQLDSETIEKHLKKLKAGNRQSGFDSSCMGPLKIRFNFFTNVFKYCSKQVTTDFITSQLNMRLKYGCIGGLLPLYIFNALIQANNQKRETPAMGPQRFTPSKFHTESDRRKATALLPKMLETASFFPQQLQLMVDA